MCFLRYLDRFHLWPAYLVLRSPQGFRRLGWHNIELLGERYAKTLVSKGLAGQYIECWNFAHQNLCMKNKVSKTFCIQILCICNLSFYYMMTLSFIRTEFWMEMHNTEKGSQGLLCWGCINRSPNPADAAIVAVVGFWWTEEFVVGSPAGWAPHSPPSH